MLIHRKIVCIMNLFITFESHLAYDYVWKWILWSPPWLWNKWLMWFSEDHFEGKGGKKQSFCVFEVWSYSTVMRTATISDATTLATHCHVVSSMTAVRQLLWWSFGLNTLYINSSVLKNNVIIFVVYILSSGETDGIAQICALSVVVSLSYRSSVAFSSKQNKKKIE